MKLYFRHGVMGSGKTTHLLQVVYNYEIRNMKVLVCKPIIDTKGNDSIVSRLGISRKVDVLISHEMNILEYIKEKLKESTIDALVVDESQFLTEEQVMQLLEIATKYNIAVICYGLKSDFLLNPFPGSSKLMMVAQDIEELKHICSCGKKATINIRKQDGKICLSGEQVLIDDSSKVEYEAICAECYFKIIDKLKEKK